MSFTACCIVLLAASAAKAATPPKKRTNVLFAIFDDLRPQLSAYNNRSWMHTPNIQSLAERSVVFNRAYTNYAYCCPSRNSLMSGRMPDTTQVWNFLESFRDPSAVDRAGLLGTDWTSLPQHFKQHGYWTVGSGKMFHPGRPPDNDNPKSWSINVSDPGGNVGCGCPDAGVPGAPMYCMLPDNTTCPDVVISTTVVSQLKEWNRTQKGSRQQQQQQQQQPFFAAVGIHKPHLPWGVPQRYFELYPQPAQIKLAEYPLEPVGMPAVAYHHCQWGPFPWNSSKGVPVTPEHASEARRAYYAAVSFADALLGDVLQAVKDIGEEENTIVLLTSDHGWQLGEHNEWCKETNFELSLRIPFMVHVPGTAPAYTDAFAENIDIYRTLSDLAMLTLPEVGVDGVSLAAVIRSSGTASPPKTAAYSQHAHCLKDPKTNATIDPFTTADSCTVTPKSQLQYMGYSVRVSDWRYTEWVEWNGAALQADWSALNATELYDHRVQPNGPPDGDFDGWENVNVATSPDNAAVMKTLSLLLHAHFAPAPRH